MNTVDIDAIKSHSEITSLSNNEIKQLVTAFRYLKNKCDEYPTIDAFAKQIFVNPINDFDYLGIPSYLFVKKILSAFLFLIQNVKYRDNRYNAFVSAIISKDRTLPSLNILSWNYDAQFEMAFAGSLPKDKNIENIWDELNVLNKTYIATDFDIRKSVGFVKLNGTAFCVNRNDLYSTYKGDVFSKIFDSFWDDTLVDKYAVANKLFFDKRYESTISYALEENRLGLLLRNTSVPLKFGTIKN